MPNMQQQSKPIMADIQSCKKGESSHEGLALNVSGNLNFLVAWAGLPSVHFHHEADDERAFSGLNISFCCLAWLRTKKQELNLLLCSF